MVASTFGPGSESMGQWGLSQSYAKVSNNEFCRLRCFWKGCFVQRFCGPKTRVSVPTMLALKEK